jgi:hypothetical protein
MKVQDKYPYNSTVTGLSNIYHTVDEDSFFINSPCILATNRIITIGKEYIIFGTPTETGIQMVDVILVDCYYREGIINLIVQDIRSQRVYSIHQSIGCPKNDCTWILVDINFFLEKMDAKAIEDYCCCCGNNLKRKPRNESNPISDDELLEFDF